VTEVVDPLAGSYFVEHLTNAVEQEAWKIYDKIEEMGGMIAALKNGYVPEMLAAEAMKKHKEISDSERTIIGVNKKVIPLEEDYPIPITEVHESKSESIAKRMEEWKKTRNMPVVKDKLTRLYADAKKGETFNLMPAIIEAAGAYATAGEIIGTFRMARGLSYDTFNMIECPYKFD